MEPLDLSKKNDQQPGMSPGGEPPVGSVPAARKASRVERLQQKLYSPNAHFEMKPRKELHTVPNQLQPGWQDTSINDFADTVPKGGLSLFAKLAIAAFVFFIGALGYAYMVFMAPGATANKDVEVTVVSPVAIGGGEELTLDVLVENKGSVPIYTVDLVIEYPDGTKSSQDLKTDLPRIRDGIGDIMPGQVVRASYDAALFGAEGDSKKIDVRVEYRLPDSTAIFEQHKEVTVALRSAPIRLLVESVKEITSQQELTFNVTVSSNSSQELKNVLVEAQYPFGFTVTEATRQPSKGNNQWSFETLRPQEQITFRVTGRLDGQNKEERVFRFNAGVAEEEDKTKLGVAFTSVERGVTITQPFLALALAIDGDGSGEVVRTGAKDIDGRLTYTNNTDAAITDARITLKLDGDVLDDTSVQVAGGFYSSADNTITWDGANNVALRNIPIGAKETLLFRFASKPLASRAAVFKNPEIIVDASVSGRRLSEDAVPEDVRSSTVTRVKFASAVVLTPVVSFTNGGPFTNTGPMPPRVEQDTTYTVTLNLTNSSNLLTDSTLTAYLPAYVRWNNQVSPSSENVTFDPVTRLITWKLGDVREHTGFITPARSAAIQLTFKPSASQIGATPVLLTNVTFDGDDSFTGKPITATPAKDITIDLGILGEIDTGKVVE
ncbi:MAG: hypothetical protein RL150_89 [Candidatus Parcubacteria bacterium]|jgi:hypothetical protein